MNCQSLHDHFFSYHEKHLSEEEKIAFDEHLNSCRECAAISSGVEFMEKMIQQKKSRQPDPFIHTRTIQRLISEGEKMAPSYQLFKTRVLRPVLLSLIILIAAGSGALTGWYIHNKTIYISEHRNEIESIRSGLSIDDFIDEGYLFTTNSSN